MSTSFDYARFLSGAATRHLTFTPNHKTPKKKRTHRFVHGGYKPIGLFDLRRSDVVWTLIPFAQLLKEHQPFSDEWTVLRKYHKAGVVGVKIPGGPVIRSAALKPVGVTLDAYIAAHKWVNDYMWDYGVTFSSYSWASEQLFRGFLNDPLKLSNPIGRRLLKTSRGLCVPGNHDGPLEKWDIRGAYPYAMLANAHKFPLSLKPIHVKEWQKHSSLILAYVYIRPSTDGEKVPIIQEHPNDDASPRETVNWFWDFELRTILDNGHHAQPLVAFKLITGDLSDELGAWHEILNYRYSANAGFEGRLLKAIANALWGSFVSSPIGLFSYQLNGSGSIELDDWSSEHFPGRSGGEHVASWVNALVSDRVYNEFLNPHEVLYFDTDGGYTKPLPKKIGNGTFGEWSFEGYANRLEVMGWQAYAAWTDDGVQVKMSGVPNASLQDLQRWGSNHERASQLQALAQDRTLSLVRAIHRTKNLITPIGSDRIPGRERHWIDIDPHVAPDISLFDVTADDKLEVGVESADMFRRLATFKTDDEIRW